MAWSPFSRSYDEKISRVMSPVYEPLARHRVLSYTCMAVALTFFLGSANWVTYFELARHGVATQGAVIKSSCSRHLTFSYRFTIGENQYEGVSNDGYKKPSCNTLEPGDPVVIYYLPSNPRINDAGDPRQHLENETVAVALAALLLPLFFLTVIVRLYGKDRN